MYCKILSSSYDLTYVHPTVSHGRSDGTLPFKKKKHSQEFKNEIVKKDS